MSDRVTPDQYWRAINGLDKDSLSTILQARSGLLNRTTEVGAVVSCDSCILGLCMPVHWYPHVRGLSQEKWNALHILAMMEINTEAQRKLHQDVVDLVINIAKELKMPVKVFLDAEGPVRACVSFASWQKGPHWH
jgi:hypothetical protein